MAKLKNLNAAETDKFIADLNQANDAIAAVLQSIDALSKARDTHEDEDARDVAEANLVMTAVRAGEMETFPDVIVGKLLDCENPVRVFREYRKITTNDLAQRVGISRPYLTLIETGKREPTFHVMARIAHKLEISLDHLAPNHDQLYPDADKLIADLNR